MVPDWVTLHPAATVLGAGTAVHLMLPGCPLLTLEGGEAERALALADTWLGPLRGEAVARALGGELLGRLLERQLLLGGDLATVQGLRPGPHVQFARPLERLVFGISATWAAVMSPLLVECAMTLVADRVDVVLTRKARRFVSPRVLGHLGVRVYMDGQASQPDEAVPHVHLAQAADAVLIAPASAATIARLAGGACSDLLSLVVAATAAPVIVAPVMNARMWQHPPIVRNVARLRADGVYVVAPGASRALSEIGSDGVGLEHRVGALGLSPENLLPVVRAIVGLSGKGRTT